MPLYFPDKCNSHFWMTMLAVHSWGHAHITHTVPLESMWPPLISRLTRQEVLTYIRAVLGLNYKQSASEEMFNFWQHGITRVSRFFQDLVLQTDSTETNSDLQSEKRKWKWWNTTGKDVYYFVAKYEWRLLKTNLLRKNQYYHRK